MSASSFTLEGAIAAAEAANCQVRYPAPNELFVDIDSEEDFALFEKHLAVFREQCIAVESVDVTPSKSGLPKRHVVVRLVEPVADATQRVLFQALLGSDRLHELLSLLAIREGTTPHPTMFFEPKEAAI